MSRVPPDEQQVLKRFFSAEGRLLDMPVRHVKRAVVLNHVAQRLRSGGSDDA